MAKRRRLTSVYAIYDFSLLANFNISLLANKDSSLMILDSLNLMEDFSFQIADPELIMLFNKRKIREVKDYIYNQYFWKKNKDIKLQVDEELVRKLLLNLHNTFFDKIQLV